VIAACNAASASFLSDRLNDQITKEAEDYAELKGMVNAEAEARANADTNLKFCCKTVSPASLFETSVFKSIFTLST